MATASGDPDERRRDGQGLFQSVLLSVAGEVREQERSEAYYEPGVQLVQKAAGAVPGFTDRIHAVRTRRQQLT